MEAFGDAVVPGVSSAVGMGLHPFRDPEVREDFEAVPLPLDLADFHIYSCEWTTDHVDHLVDGRVVRSTEGPPRYPLQLMLAVFDFPARSVGGDDELSRSSLSTGSADSLTPRVRRRGSARSAALRDSLRDRMSVGRRRPAERWIGTDVRWGWS